MAKLTINERDRSTVHEILEEAVTVGRKQGVTVRLGDPSASSEHCQIRRVPGVGFKLIDLESMNGTKVNGAYVNQAVLKDGDVIQVGAVIINFSSEGVEVSSAPPPIVARATVARPAAARARPSRAAPAGGEDDFVPRRRSGRGSNAPFVILGTIVGLLFFGLAIVFVFGLAEPTLNENVFFEMRDLMRESKYAEALEVAKQADPASDAYYWRKIQSEVQNLKDLKSFQTGISRSKSSRAEYDQLEIWWQNNRSNRQGFVAKLDAYIAKYDRVDKYWANQARIRRNDILGISNGPEDEPGGGPAVVPVRGASKIDRAWQVAEARSKRLELGDRYQEAIDAIMAFWDENQLLAERITEWKRRVDGSVKRLEEKAEARWETLDERAKVHVDKGEYDSAIRLYRAIAEKFGMPKYQRQAGEAIRKLNRD